MKKPHERRPWFRLYSELLHDPKVQTLPEPMFKAYINTLCIAGMNDPRGVIPPLADYAFLLRVGEKQAEKIRNFLEISKLLEKNGDDFFIHNWDERQFESDNVTLRTQRHREKKKRSNSEHGNVPETFPGTPPESESESESEDITTKLPVSEKKKSVVSPQKATTDTPLFFELTPERMAWAQAQGFSDASWVRAQTARFIDVNDGKRIRHPEQAWQRWLEKGRELGIESAPAFRGRQPKADDFPLTGRPHL